MIASEYSDLAWLFIVLLTSCCSLSLTCAIFVYYQDNYRKKKTRVVSVHVNPLRDDQFDIV